MRTTLTLDDDVAALLKRIQKRRKADFRVVVNDALRHGLMHLDQERRPLKAYRTEPMNLGQCLIPSLDCTAEALAVAEGEDFK